MPRTGMERTVQRKAARLSLDTTAHASTAYQEFVRQLAPMAVSLGAVAGQAAGIGVEGGDCWLAGQRLVCRQHVT